MSDRIVEIKLKELSITNRGTMSGKEDINAIAFTLSYPRAGTPSVTTVKEIKYRQPIPDNFPSLSYEKQIVFKEKIQGETQLVVDVVAIDNPSKFAQFFTKIFKGVLKAVFGSVTKGIGNVVTAAVAETVGESIFDGIEVKKSVQKIGRVIIPIGESDLVGQGEIEKELRVPSKVVKIEEDDEGEEIEEIILQKNQLNGSVVLSYKQL